MCGICGQLNFNDQSVDPSVILKMILAMEHRGPDDKQFFVNGKIGLGHCRLKVIDLSTRASQPMIDRMKRFSIVYNGEIYNFRKLRRELISMGAQFYSNSDTEVILEAYKRWGVDCLHKFDGMFAFAIWDNQRDQLFLARDRFGVKPLYFFHLDQTVVFSSELKALTEHPECPRELCYDAINEYLALNYISGERSIYKDVYKLLPGHFVLFSEDGLQIKRWYDLVVELERKESITDFMEAQRAVRSVLDEAIQKRMISDVPLGAFLSGGLDSSIIVGVMAASSDQPIKTFSVGYVSYEIYDETKYARKAAKKFGTDHHELILSHQHILDSIPRVLNSFGEPLGDPSILPTNILCQHTRGEVTVALSGDAGDEVFAGYRKYLGEHYYQYYRHLPEFVRERILPRIFRILPEARDKKVLDVIRQIRKFFEGAAEQTHERHYGWMEVWRRAMRMRLLGRVEGNGMIAPEEIILRIGEGWKGDDPINKMLYTDVHCCLPYNMFHKVDVASMLNSLEVRSPFIDHHLIELAFCMPGKFKLRGRTLKHILRETYRDLLPAEILKRGKHGFDVPVGEWFRNELKELFRDVVFGQSDDIIDCEGIKNIFDLHLSRRQDYSFPLWNIFVLKWWLNNNKYTS